MTLNCRFSPYVQRAKQLIDEGFLGRVTRFRGGYRNSGSVDPEKPVGWRQGAAAGGGVINGPGSRAMDLIDWLIGRLREVQAETRILYPRRPDRHGGVVEAPKIATGAEDDLRVQIDGECGAVGFKRGMAVHGLPSSEAAEEEWKEANQNKECPAVRDLLLEKRLDVAAGADVPAAVRTGYRGDFRNLDRKHMFSLAVRRRDVRFDMFHPGMPMIRDAVMIGKTLPNVKALPVDGASCERTEDRSRKLVGTETLHPRQVRHGAASLGVDRRRQEMIEGSQHVLDREGP